MNKIAPIAVAASLLLSLSACGSEGRSWPVGTSTDGPGPGPGPGPDPVVPTTVTIDPPRWTIMTGRTKLFVATPSTVTWSLLGANPGQITQLGLYTAPDAEGVYTVVATETRTGLVARATVTVIPSTGGTHGLTIPSNHPRLWFDSPARLAAARTWAAAHPASMPPVDTGSPNAEDYYEAVAVGLLTSNATYCNFVKNWAIGQSTGMTSGSVSCDNCRWFGEMLILAYDWCYDAFSPAERSTYVTNTNTWLNYWRQQNWGGPAMPENNYHWGYTRNELEWAITSYEDNVAAAEVFLDDVFTSRLQNNVYPAMEPTGGMKGGIGREGTQYGIYIPFYASIPWMTAGLMGRDLFAESPYWMEAAYAMIYAVTPAPTTVRTSTNLNYTFFPYSDDENWLSVGEAMNEPGTRMSMPATYLSGIAQRFPGTNLEGHARQWLATIGSTPRVHALSTDPGGSPRAFTDLPLDYYAAGAGHLYGRSAWGATSTAFQWDMRDGPGNGHAHSDWGSFQIWRNGRFVTRESVAYGENVAGYHGSGTITANRGLGHNVLLIDGVESHSDQWIDRLADVTRLETRADFTYAATDLKDTFNNSSFVAWVREYVFVRALETTVILDRVQSATANQVKTFLVHCDGPVTTASASAVCTSGTQELAITTLVPASPTYGVVAEGGTVGQNRIEIDTSPGTAQSYILTVLQAKASGSAGRLAPSVSEDGTSFTVTLDGSNSIVFQKGMTSANGSITTPSGTTAFRVDAQPLSVTSAGPQWQ